MIKKLHQSGGSSGVDTVHRLNLSCPGEHWCCRGRCPDIGVSEADALLTLIVTRGHAAAAASSSGDEFWRRSYQDLYGDEDRLEDSEQVLDQLVVLLESSGWVELSESTWEGGLEERLLRRHEYCLTASYDPVTRQIELSDGHPALELTLQILAEEGVLVDDNGQERLDTSEGAIEDWGADLLTAADDMLGGRIKESARLASPVQITVLGLHPYADGSLRAPEAPSLAEMQLRKLCEVVGVSSTET